MNIKECVRSSFRRFGTLYVKKAKLLGTAFLLYLLGRREICLTSAGMKINEMIAKHVHTGGFVLVDTCIMY